MEKLATCGNIHDLHCSQSRTQVACSQCSLEALCLPRGLSMAEVTRFEQIVRRSRPIQPAEHLFRTGDAFHDIVSVRVGCFKSYIIDCEGHEQVLGFYFPGEIMGLDAIHSRRHSANAVALDTGAVCSLDFESIARMACHMPKLQAELFRSMSQRISELEIIAGDLSADERMANFLMSLSKRFSSRGYSHREFSLAMSRSDIASYLHLATETVSRVLARFQKAGWLLVDRKKIKIRDFEKLQELSSHSAQQRKRISVQPAVARQSLRNPFTAH